MNANAEILTGDLAAYLDLLERVTSTCPPSSGFDLDGMRIDVEHYLGQDSMLSDVRLHRFDEPLADPSAPLIMAWASWGLRAEAYGPRERAAFLEWHWQRWLSYRHADEHVVTATPDGHLHLHGVTQIDVEDFYVTLHVDVAPATTHQSHDRPSVDA